MHVFYTGHTQVSFGSYLWQTYKVPILLLAAIVVIAFVLIANEIYARRRKRHHLSPAKRI
jgi:hypothetical protein